MRIAIVCMDLSSNVTISAIGMADALSGHHEVVIAGPQFGPALSSQLATRAYRVIPTPAVRGPEFLRALPGLMRSIRDSDLIIACKPRGPSVAPAVLAKLLWRKPFILYADDDELAMTWPSRQRRWRDRIRDPGSDLYARLAVRLRRLADAVIVSCSSLQRTLGGEVILAPRTLPGFDPSLHDRDTVRTELGMRPEDFVLGFIGIPRAHKGLDEVLEFVGTTQLPNVRLLIAPPLGFTDLSHIRKELDRPDSRILLIEGQPSSAVPRLLAACDVIPILQRPTSEAEGQIPAKLIEAMAMGRAIVATAVSDIPAILSDCGLVLPPDRPERFAGLIEQLYRDRALAKHLGERARARYLDTISVGAVGPRLRAVVERAARGRRDTVANQGA